MNRRFVIVFTAPAFAALLFTLFAPFGIAAPAESNIYQWTDESGQVHFSTSPQKSGAAPSQLPKLQRENIDSRIKNIKAATPLNCENHGGIDCSRGPDADRSVICLDGYRDAVAPFQFQCIEARLQAEFLVVTAQDPAAYIGHSRRMQEKLADKPLHGLQLTLRNLSGIQAYGIDVDIFLGHRRLIRAPGPDKLDPYGNADYVLNFAELPEAPTIAEIERTEYKVKCTNCSTVLKGPSQ